MVLGGEKERIVPKSLLSDFDEADGAEAGPVDGALGLAIHVSEDAPEASCARQGGAKMLQQQGVIGLRVGLRGVPFGVDTGGAIQGVDLQAGVIGNAWLLGILPDEPSFLQSVLFEGVSRLRRFWDVGEISEGLQYDIRAFEEGANL